MLCSEPFSLPASFILSHGMLQTLINILNWDDRPQDQLNVLHILINICLLFKFSFFRQLIHYIANYFDHSALASLSGGEAISIAFSGFLEKANELLLSHDLRLSEQVYLFLHHIIICSIRLPGFFFI